MFAYFAAAAVLKHYNILLYVTLRDTDTRRRLAAAALFSYYVFKSFFRPDTRNRNNVAVVVIIPWPLRTRSCRFYLLKWTVWSKRWFVLFAGVNRRHHTCRRTRESRGNARKDYRTSKGATKGRLRRTTLDEAMRPWLRNHKVSQKSSFPFIPCPLCGFRVNLFNYKSSKSEQM